MSIVYPHDNKWIIKFASSHICNIYNFNLNYS